MQDDELDFAEQQKAGAIQHKQQYEHDFAEKQRMQKLQGDHSHFQQQIMSRRQDEFKELQVSQSYMTLFWLLGRNTLDTCQHCHSLANSKAKTKSNVMQTDQRLAHVPGAAAVVTGRNVSFATPILGRILAGMCKQQAQPMPGLVHAQEHSYSSMHS